MDYDDMDDDMLEQVKAAEERGELQPGDIITFRWDNRSQNYKLKIPKNRKKTESRSTI